MDKRRFSSQAVEVLTIFIFILNWQGARAAELAGTVIDSLTKLPISGAQVSAELSGQTLGRGFSGSDGRFSVSISPPTNALSSVTAIISVPDYDEVSVPIQFQNGAALQNPTIPMALHWIGACKAGFDHSVVVGYFLPPAATGAQTDLTERVARSMSFALAIKLQQIYLAPDLQPSFEPCPAAKPRTPQLGASVAKALFADAFVGGDVAHLDSASFKVSTYVSDAYGRLGPFVVAVNRSVDLDSPSGATMADETHVAVLAAVAAGLINKQDCATAMKVLNVAEQMTTPAPDYLVRMKDYCVAQLPNRRLLSGGPP
ncbi:carboxypeptidase-like regulatory domain-containing protein [Rhizobium johnstonii]|uniref:carboxypeptidase-like regulatory domain-containing protein n=1 Tax=Rhizobium johnstonii TaxID=3019933 RepID=UPI003F982232